MTDVSGSTITYISDIPSYENISVLKLKRLLDEHEDKGGTAADYQGQGGPGSHWKMKSSRWLWLNGEKPKASPGFWNTQRLLSRE